jgi:hypothetical protein
MTFDFSPHIAEELDILRGRLRAETRGDVIRKALKVLAWVESNLHHGHKILVKKTNGDTYDASFPFLHPNK